MVDAGTGEQQAAGHGLADFKFYNPGRLNGAPSVFDHV
jgi:hypothetical protein